MTAVSELLLLTSTDLKLNPQGPELENISESIKSHDKSFESLHSSIRKLQEALEALSKSSAPASSAGPTNTESTDKLLAEISSKLESICHEEMGISAGLSELKQSITTVQSSARQSAIPPSGIKQ
jgi:chromosome segregation ATPase